MLVATDRLAGAIDAAQAVGPSTHEDSTDRRFGDNDLAGDLHESQAPTPPGLDDPLDHRRWCSGRHGGEVAGTIALPGGAFGPETSCLPTGRRRRNFERPRGDGHWPLLFDDESGMGQSSAGSRCSFSGARVPPEGMKRFLGSSTFAPGGLRPTPDQQHVPQQRRWSSQLAAPRN